MKILFALSFFFLTFLHSPGFQSNKNNYETQLTNAMELVFNFKFEKAESLLLQLSKENRIDPKPLLYISNIYVWKFIGDNNQNDFKKFETYSNETIERAKSTLKKDEKNYSALFTLSSIYGYRSIMFLMNKDYLDGLWSAKTSLSYADELIKKNPFFIDAYLWKGIFLAAISQIPETVKKILDVVGIEGDLSKGIEDLELVSKNGNFAKVEADYFLSQIYSLFLGENQKAYDLLKRLVNRFPDNSLFKYSFAVESMKLNRLEEAENNLIELIKSNSFQITAIRDLTFFLLGDCNFYQNEYSDAISYYEKFLITYKKNQYKPTASFRCGLSYMLSGDFEKGKKFLSKSLSIKSKIEEDKFYQRFASKILKNGVDEITQSIFISWNLIRDGNFNQAISRLNTLSNLDQDNISIVLYLKGLASYRNQSYREAKELFLQVIQVNTKNELWTKGFSYLYLGRIEIKNNNIQSAIRYLEKIDDLENFDFQQSIKYQAKNLMNYLQKK